MRIVFVAIPQLLCHGLGSRVRWLRPMPVRPAGPPRQPRAPAAQCAARRQRPRPAPRPPPRRPQPLSGGRPAGKLPGRPGGRRQPQVRWPTPCVVFVVCWALRLPCVVRCVCCVACCVCGRVSCCVCRVLCVMVIACCVLCFSCVVCYVCCMFYCVCCFFFFFCACQFFLETCAPPPPLWGRKEWVGGSSGRTTPGSVWDAVKSAGKFFWNLFFERARFFEGSPDGAGWAGWVWLTSRGLKKKPAQQF